MRSFLAALFAALFAVTAGLGQGPPRGGTVVVPAPNVAGGTVKLVNRDQMRAGPGVKTARMSHALRAAVDAKAIKVPDSWDWTKKAAVKLPMLGNNQYGDCYYVTICKLPILHQFNVQGTQLDFNTNDVVKRYLKLSGGDNGLSDYDVFPEYKGGVIGPGGPHKALDILVVPSTDLTALKLTGWAFGPHMFTFTVYTNFTDKVGPGVIFDSSSGRNVGGHAVPFSGRTADGKWQLETWAIQPSVLVTDNWIRTVDPEFIAVFSLEWFDSKGYAPNGEHYTTLAPLWESIGGKKLPPSPFPPPVGPGPTQPTLDLTVTPLTLPKGGGQVQVTWNTTNATSVTMNGIPIIPSGTKTDTLTGDFTYVVTATGGAGTTPVTKTASVDVQDGPTPPTPVQPIQVIVGGQAIGIDPVAKQVTLPAGWTAYGASGGNMDAASVKAACDAAFSWCPAASAAAAVVVMDIITKAPQEKLKMDLTALALAVLSCQVQTPAAPSGPVPQVMSGGFSAGACDASQFGACGTAGSFGACSSATAFGSAEGGLVYRVTHPFAGRFAATTAAGSYSQSATGASCSASVRSYRFAPFGGRFRR